MVLSEDALVDGGSVERISGATGQNDFSSNIGTHSSFLYSYLSYTKPFLSYSALNMYLDQDAFFSPKEYLLGDSAFTPGEHMIPAFKHPPKANMPAEESSFNTLLAKPRVKSEHCIGLLKGKFPWLKNIRITIHAKKDLKQINKFIKAANILHNLLIETPYEEEWIVDEAFLELDDDHDIRDSHNTGLHSNNL
jgi:hypothetical protein